MRTLSWLLWRLHLSCLLSVAGWPEIPLIVGSGSRRLRSYYSIYVRTLPAVNRVQVCRCSARRTHCCSGRTRLRRCHRSRRGSTRTASRRTWCRRRRCSRCPRIHRWPPTSRRTRCSGRGRCTREVRRRSNTRKGAPTANAQAKRTFATEERVNIS